MSLPVFLQIIDIRKDYRERGEVGGRQTPARGVWRLLPGLSPGNTGLGRPGQGMVTPYHHRAPLTVVVTVILTNDILTGGLLFGFM